MLIDSFLPVPHFAEKHSIKIRANQETVYQAVRTADLGGSAIVKGLLLLRSLPQFFLQRGPRQPRANTAITLRTLVNAGFGILAEEPPREIVLGVTGPFWRLVGNVLPFNAEDFKGAVRPGVARAVWNFSVAETAGAHSILTTETRIVCGDAASRRKFRAYWLLVRPFSGLIRLLMLRAIRQSVRHNPESVT
ncbi:MAG: hypothetical protein ABI596_00605 [Pyrinomonadaceae bacterium]